MSEVKWFYMNLKELLVKNGLTIKTLCEKSDLNYMSTLKVIKGERLLKEECFNKIINSACFSKEECHQLKRSFEHKNISKNDREKVESIVYILKSIYETVVEKSVYENINNEVLGCQNYLSDMCGQINDHIYKSYTNVLKEVFLKEKASFEFILFLPDMPTLIHEVFHTLKALISCLDHRVDWKVNCMILRAKEDEDSMPLQMVTLSKYLKLGLLSKNIEINVLENAEKEKVKYGIYFKERTMFLNKAGNDFIVEYKDHRNKFNHLNFHANDLFKSFYNREGFNTYLKSIMENEGYVRDNHYGIRSYLSAVSMGETFIKNNNLMIDDNKTGIPEGDCHGTLKLYLDREKHIFANKNVLMTQCICESGIEGLLRDGIVPDYSLMGQVLNDRSRLALIYDALEKIKLGYELRLLPIGTKHKYPYLALINFFEIHQKNKQWMFARSKPPNECLNTKSYKNNDLMYGIVIEDPNLVASFELFCKHVMTYKTLDSKTSVQRIKAMVLKYYENHKDTTVQDLIKQIKDFEL
jgi:hypothetical protein